MSDEVVEDFLEHYGIPGMKWGKRKGNSDSNSGELKPGAGRGLRRSSNRPQRTPQEQARRNRQINAGIRLGVAGALYFAPQILGAMNKSYGSLLNAADAKNMARAKAGKATADSLIRGIGNTPTASLFLGANGRWQL